MPIIVQRTLKIGLTGGIGAGKSYVSSIFVKKGISVYDSDMRAKALMVSDSDLIVQIKDCFGTAAYHQDGSLNRGYIAQIVFNNPDALMVLNSIVHPVLKQDAQQWFEKQKNVYAIQEAAILFESNMEQYLDYSIMVYAPREVREQRVVQRDKISIEDVRARISKQMPDEEKLQKADFVIYNSGQEDIEMQIENLDQQLRRIAMDSENLQTL